MGNFFPPSISTVKNKDHLKKMFIKVFLKKKKIKVLVFYLFPDFCW